MRRSIFKISFSYHAILQNIKIINALALLLHYNYSRYIFQNQLGCHLKNCLNRLFKKSIVNIYLNIKYYKSMVQCLKHTFNYRAILSLLRKAILRWAYLRTLLSGWTTSINIYFLNTEKTRKNSYWSRRNYRKNLLCLTFASHTLTWTASYSVSWLAHTQEIKSSCLKREKVPKRRIRITQIIPFHLPPFVYYY